VQAEIAKLRHGELDIAQREGAAMGTRISQLTEECSRLSSKLRETESRLTLLQGQHTQLRSEHTAQLGDVEHHRNQAISAAAAAAAAAAESTRADSALSGDARQLAALHAEAEARADALAVRAAAREADSAAALSALQRGCDDLRSEKAELWAQLQTLQTSLQHAHALAAQQERAIDAARAAAAAHAAAAGPDAAAAAAATASAGGAPSPAVVAALYDQACTLEQLIDRNAALSADLTETRAARAAADEQLRAHAEAARARAADLEVLTARAVALETRLAQTRGENEQLRNALAAGGGAGGDDRSRELEDAYERIMELQQSEGMLGARVNELSVVITTLQSSSETVTIELHSARAAAADREQALEQALARAAALQQSQAETERALDAATHNLSAAEHALDALRRASGDGEAAARAVNAALDEARVRATAESARADRLQQELQERDEQHARALAAAKAAERATAAAAAETAADVARHMAADAAAAAKRLLDDAGTARARAEARAAAAEAALSVAHRRLDESESAVRAARAEGAATAAAERDGAAAVRLMADAAAQQVEALRAQLSQVPLAQQRAADAEARAERLQSKLERATGELAAERAAAQEAGAVHWDRLERQWRDLHTRLKAELAAAVRENERIAGCYTRTLDGLADADDRARASQREAEALRADLEALAALRERDYAAAAAQIRDLSQIAARNEDLEAELAAARAGTADSMVQLAAAQAGVERARGDCTEMQRKQDSLHGLIAALQRQVGELEARVEAVPQLRAAYADAAGAYEDMFAAAGRANEDARALEAHAAAMRAQLADATAAAAAAARERDAVADAHAQLSQSHKRLSARYAQRAAEAAAARERWEDELEAERRRASALAEAERTAAAAKASAERELTAAREASEREVARLQSRVETLMGEYAALVKSKLHGDAAVVSQLNGSLAAEREGARRWEAEARDAGKQVAALQAQLATQAQQLQTLQITVQQQLPLGPARERAAVEAEEKHSAAVQTGRDYEARYEAGLEQIDRLRAERQELSDEVQVERGRREDAQQQRGELEQHLARAAADLAHARGQVAQFEDALGKAEDVARSQVAVIEALTQSGQQFKIGEERAAAELAAAAARHKEAKDAMVTLRAERDSLATELSVIRDTHARDVAKVRDAHTQDVFTLREQSFSEVARLKEEHQRELKHAGDTAARDAQAAAAELARAVHAAAAQAQAHAAELARADQASAAERAREAKQTAAEHALALQTLRSEHAAAATVLQSKVDRALERCAAADARVQELTQQATAAANELAATKQALDAERERAERALGDGRALDRAVRAADARLAEAAEKERELSGAVTAAREELERVRREGTRAADELRVALSTRESELQLTAKQLHTATERGVALEDKLRQSEEAVAKRDREILESRHRAAADLAGAERELDRVRTALGDAERRGKALAADLAARTEELADANATARMREERLAAAEREDAELKETLARRGREAEAAAAKAANELEKRREELERCQQEGQKLRLEVERKELQVASLTERAKSLEQMKGNDMDDMLRRRLNEAIVHADHLEFQARAREAELQDAKAARGKLEDRLRAAEERVAALNYLPHEINRLKHLDNAFEAEKIAKRNVEDENARVQAELRVAKSDATRLARQLDDAERVVARAREETAELDRELRAERKAELERAGRLRDESEAALKRQADKHEEAVRELRARLAEAATSVVQREGEATGLQLRLDALATKLASLQTVSSEDARACAAALETEVRALRQSEAELARKLSAAKGEGERLAGRLRDTEAEAEQLRDARQHPGLRAQVSALEKERDDCKARYCDARGKLAEAVQRLELYAREKQASAAAVSQLSLTLLESNKKLELSVTAEQQLKKQLADAQSFRPHMERAHAERDRVAAVNAALEGTLAEKDATIARLNTALEKPDHALERVTRERDLYLVQKERAVAQAHATVSALRAREAELTAALRDTERSREEQSAAARERYGKVYARLEQTATQLEAAQAAYVRAEAERDALRTQNTAAAADTEARLGAAHQRSLAAQTELAAREAEWRDAEEEAAHEIAALRTEVTRLRDAAAREAEAVRCALARAAAASGSAGAGACAFEPAAADVPEAAAAQASLRSVSAALSDVESTLAAEQALVRSVCMGMLNPPAGIRTGAGAAAGAASEDAARVLRSLGLYDEAQSLEASLGRPSVAGGSTSSAVAGVLGPAPAPFTALLPSSVTVSAVSSALFEALSSVWTELSTLQARFRLRDPNSNTATELARLTERGSLCQQQFAALWQQALSTRATLLNVTSSARAFAEAATRSSAAVARAVSAAGSEAALWHSQLRARVFDVDASNVATRLALIDVKPCRIIAAVPALKFAPGATAHATDAPVDSADAVATLGSDGGDSAVSAQLEVDRDVLLAQRAELVRQLQTFARHYDESVLRARVHVEQDRDQAAATAAAHRQIADLQEVVQQLVLEKDAAI
jgi:chromosome segregation ATPase